MRPAFASVVVLVLAALCSSCLYARIMYFGVPTLSAPTYFDHRVVRATRPTPLRARSPEVNVTVTTSLHKTYPSFDALLRENQTRAFLWVHDGTIQYERYFNEAQRTTQFPSYSMSKTFAAVLVGCAIDDGRIRTVDDRLISYVPELLPKADYDKVTIDHLLRMTAGINFVEESYQGAALFYTNDLRARMYGYDIKWPPGTHYLYGSVSMQLVWDALSRRMPPETSVSKYFEERVWGPIGAEHAAAWALDSEASGIEKLFGGFSATTRDHARIGMLFLNDGVMEGRTVVSPAWIKASLEHDDVAGVVHTTDGSVRRAKYQWFWTMDGRAYFAKGYQGQYVFVIPEKRMVFVRFGDDYGDVDWPALFFRLAEGR